MVVAIDQIHGFHVLLGHTGNRRKSLVHFRFVLADRPVRWRIQAQVHLVVHESIGNIHPFAAQEEIFKKDSGPWKFAAIVLQFSPFYLELSDRPSPLGKSAKVTYLQATISEAKLKAFSLIEIIRIFLRQTVQAHRR